MPIQCPHCRTSNNPSGARTMIVSSGSYYRKSDQSRQQRYNCRSCGRSFSTASSQLCYRQRKRELNPQIFKLLASGISQRRLALVLAVNRKTIVRKFIFLGVNAHLYLGLDRLRYAKSSVVEFDDLETFEHSKMKPLSVIMAVESKTRRILGFRVARMPAKGLLVKRALKKYGPRKDCRKKAREELFAELTTHVSQNAIFKSDQNPHYPSSIKRHFPTASHFTTKGRRGCVVGQGELKAGGFDPLFTLNHTFAMFRANINRLFRRTWNTTKKPERLDLHIAIYALMHNLALIKK